MVLRAHPSIASTAAMPLANVAPGTSHHEYVSSSSGGACPGLAALYHAGHRHLLARGDVFFCQGDTAASLCWVLEGRVMLSVVSEDGREVIVGVAGPGTVFGETALTLVGGARTTTAIALEPSAVLQVGVGVLTRLSRARSDVGVLVLQSLLVRMADLQARLAEHMMAGSEERLVHVLLLLASAEDSSGTARLPLLSQEVLARMVGTTRSRVNRLLRGLRSHGVRPTASGIRLEMSSLRRWQRRTGGASMLVRPASRATPSVVPA